MAVNYFSFLTVLVTISVAKHELYIFSKDNHAKFTKFDIKPYSGLQECIEACNVDENCYAFGINSRINSNQINCFISNGSQSSILDSAVEVWVKPGEQQISVGKTCLEENTLPGNCPNPFVRLRNLTGCYYPAVNEHVTWQEAEDACQDLDSRAHLISFDSPEVRLLGRIFLYIFHMILFSRKTCQYFAYRVFVCFCWDIKKTSDISHLFNFLRIVQTK